MTTFRNASPHEISAAAVIPEQQSEPAAATEQSGRGGSSLNSERFRKLVQRIAEWTDAEVAVVCPRQVRHVAKLVAGGADPEYPPFAILRPSVRNALEAAVRARSTTENLRPVERGALEAAIADLESFVEDGLILDDIENWAAFGEHVMLCLHELKRLRSERSE